jgi:hypothetical protein
MSKKNSLETLKAAEPIILENQLSNSRLGPLNGQSGRQEMVKKIINGWQPSAIVETGTYTGITSEWLAKITKVQIYTCENNKKFYSQAASRLSQYKNIALFLSDSRKMLNDISVSSLSKQRVLFYLDAHWDADLPLQDEISIILRAFNDPVILIDDFRVPFDFGYKYDKYGPNKILNLSLLKECVNEQFYIAFPKLNSSQETGEKRGCALIANHNTMNKLEELIEIYSDNLLNWQIKEMQMLDSELYLATKKCDELIFHCNERLKQIDELTDLNKKRLKQIDELTYHRDERLKQIDELTDLNKKRLKQIDELTYHCNERLKQIEELHRLIKILEFRGI